MKKNIIIMKYNIFKEVFKVKRKKTISYDQQIHIN